MTYEIGDARSRKLGAEVGNATAHQQTPTPPPGGPKMSKSPSQELADRLEAFSYTLANEEEDLVLEAAAFIRKQSEDRERLARIADERADKMGVLFEENWQLKSTISRLTSELEAAREGLRPFAETAAVLDQRIKDDAVWAGQRPAKPLTFGHFRQAAALLSPPAQGEG